MQINLCINVIVNKTLHQHLPDKDSYYILTNISRVKEPFLSKVRCILFPVNTNCSKMVSVSLI